MLKVKIKVKERFKPGDEVRYKRGEEDNSVYTVESVEKYREYDAEYIADYYGRTDGYRVNYTTGGWDASFILEKVE